MTILNRLHEGFVSLRSQIKVIILSIKNEGFKATFKKYRWKFIAVVFVYYLIRDLLLYVAIPSLTYYVASN